MKTIVLLVSVVALAACSGEASTNGPTKLSDAAVAGMWSIKPPEQVSACLAQIGPSASGAIGEPLRFEAKPADPRKTRYVTVVSIYGDVSSHLGEAEAAARCL